MNPVLMFRARSLFLYVFAYTMDAIADFVKNRRKQLGLIQEDLAENAGVALTVIRKIEQGKDNLNQVLMMCGHS